MLEVLSYLPAEGEVIVCKLLFRICASSNMGALYSKLRSETSAQRSWRFICLKKSPASTPGTMEFLPNFRDLYISGRGMDRISLSPDLSWPDKYLLEIPIGQLHQYQNRFRCKRLHVHSLSAPALNDLLTAYSRCYNAQLSEVHLFQCETENTRSSRLHAFLKSQNMKSAIVAFTDSNNCIKMAKSRTLGSEGYISTQFYLKAEIVFEHKFRNRPKERLEQSKMAQGSDQRDWMAIKRGKLPLQRFVCQQLNILIASNKIHVTPDLQWDKSHELSCQVSKLSLYLQFVDCAEVCVTCTQINDKTRQMVVDFIVNLSLSQCLLSAREFTFYGVDFLLVDQETFRRFLEPRKTYLEPLGFDQNCRNMLQVEMAIEATLRRSPKKERNHEKRVSYAESTKTSHDYSDIDKLGYLA